MLAVWAAAEATAVHERVGVRYGSPLASTAQAIRAILLASATPARAMTSRYNNLKNRVLWTCQPSDSRFTHSRVA
jgi:hypothetical protein